MPILQTLNLFLGLLILAWEWPLKFLTTTNIYSSIKVRLFALPLTILCALFLYQAIDAAMYYIIGMGIYFWAYREGEVILYLGFFLKLTYT
jgi:hypothetical protein